MFTGVWMKRVLRIQKAQMSNFFQKQAHARLIVVGIGGAGGNAVNRMVVEGVNGVEFVAMNTDAQVLGPSLAQEKIRLGENITRGLGAGGDPKVGEQAARESERLIQDTLDGADMVFLTGGMGGGTGTGAAPVVAEIARRMGILTVAVVSKPFGFEGPRRKRFAEEGSLRLAEHVDTLIVVPNDRLLDVVDKKASMQDAFDHADDILRQGVQGISDIITRAGMINLDFADVRSVMKDAGVATMGMGRAQGESRARMAAEQAANSPLLETSIAGAKKLLVNITSGEDFSLGEIHEAMEYLQQFVDPDDAEIFVGHVMDPSIGGDVCITVLAAGMPKGGKHTHRDESVFTHAVADSRRREDRMLQPDVSDSTAAPAREISRPTQLDELDLDIPSFLRRQKTGN